MTWLPFLEPINALHASWWVLLIPLCFGISVVYKAVRMTSLDRFWMAVAVMTTQFLLSVLGLGILLALFVLFVIPRLPAGS